MSLMFGESAHRRCGLPATFQTLESFESELKAALEQGG